MPAQGWGYVRMEPAAHCFLDFILFFMRDIYTYMSLNM